MKIHNLLRYKASAIASIAILLYFSLIPKLVFAQTTPQDVIQAQEVRPLPGKLDNIPVFNSNSPEGVKPRN